MSEDSAWREEKKVREEKKGKMPGVLVFGGTTESLAILDFLRRFDIDVTLSVATEYGRESVRADEKAEVICGRMDREEILELIAGRPIHLVIDATHPFAVAISDNIRWACERAPAEYIRCLREKMKETEDEKPEKMICVDSLQEAVEYLKSVKGNILITTGSKELRKFCEIPDYQTRCYARVLSVPDSVESSARCGFRGRHLIAMQAPFSKEMNIATIHYAGASFFVTKESGAAGGMKVKIQACSETGTTLVVIRRPGETGKPVKEVCDDLDKKFQKYRI